ncbi:MAG TPA: DUF308 domain-containing protein [Bacillota bacterium]|nr:DUF308 domain-containing protein [Bacillota bacterium]HUM56185.1 DUF308 domain-containing protein [Bacillota bacterium]
MQLFKQMKVIGIIIGALIFIIGVVFVARPVKVEILLDWVLGISLMIGGISMIGKVIAERNEKGNIFIRMIPGIALLVIAAFALINEGLTVFMVGIIIGIAAFFMAFERLTVANERRKAAQSWGTVAIFGVIQIFFGAFMLYATFSMIAALIMIIGIYLMITGISLVISSAIFPLPKGEK